MTIVPEPQQAITHDLGNNCLFQVRQLSEALVWAPAQFEEAWSLHPNDKHQIMIHGRLVATPRWQQAYGADYHYTGRINQALPVPELLKPLLNWGRETIHPDLNGLLLNWYEGPGHYIGQHHDSTRHMVVGAPIVTVSFGETRIFRLTLDEKKAVRHTRDFPAPHGMVFVMPYDTNLVWKHGVPKSARYTGRRISVTLRAFTNEKSAAGVAGNG